jgi:hypothetical protein
VGGRDGAVPEETLLGEVEVEPALGPEDSEGEDEREERRDGDVAAALRRGAGVFGDDARVARSGREPAVDPRLAWLVADPASFFRIA